MIQTTTFNVPEHKWFKQLVLPSDSDVIKGQKELLPHLANKKTEVEKENDTQVAEDQSVTEIGAYTNW